MPQNNPRPPKRSWRGDRSVTSRPLAGQPAWKAERSAKSGPRVSRGMKIGLAAALLLVVVTVFLVVLFWPRSPDPFRLVLVGAGYDHNLAAPVNSLGRRGLDGLEQWAKDYNAQPFGQGAKNVEVRRKTVEESNDAVGEEVANTSAPTVVVFLTGDGGGDEQGAYILPENGGPRNLDAVYRIDKVLDAFKKLPEKTHKFLLLDASSNGPDWAMRQLHNDFIRSVKKLEPRVKEIPNCVVLCSCDEGQQSWTSPEFGQTIFVHYVIEGLKGAADKPLDGETPEDYKPNGGRITALKLTRYVQFQVERWSRRNRSAQQKPLLIGDEEVATGMELGVADEKYKEPDPKTLAAWSPPDELLAAWKEHDELAKSSPSPAANTPAQWREYEAALLRYEQLLRTDPGGTTVGDLRQRVRKLYDQIFQTRRLDRASMSVSLAAPAAFGWSLAPDPNLPDQLKVDFERVWGDKTAKADQFKALLAGASNPTEERLTRLRLVGLLLDKAQVSRDSYQRACDVLPKVVESPGPAEANFAVTAHLSEQRLPAGTVASWARLGQALTLRRSAETAALGQETKAGEPPAYSEQVAPWIEALVEKADIQRRLGEDLLFASASEDAQAGAALDAAESNKDFGYKVVRDRALIVRQAIQARDQALAELPWYTQWLGRRLLTKEEDKKQLTDVLALWANVHDLCRQLEPADFAKAAPPDSKTTNAVNAGMQKLRDDFRTACGDKDKQWAVLQDDLRKLEDLLSIPLVEPAVRMNLLRNAGRISWELNKETTDAAAQGAESEVNAAEGVKKLAFQQLRLAVAVLGTDNEDARRADNLRQAEDKPVWQPDLDTAGDEIGRGFQVLARNAAEAADKARKAPTADAAAPLRSAALATRFLDAGQADAWLSTVDPAAENRALQLHNLLVWQAERTYRDYWASPDPANPYYRAAGLVCSGDAHDLVAGAAATDLKDEEKDGRLTEVKRVEALLRPADEFAVRWLDGRTWRTAADLKDTWIHVTDVYNINFQYGLVGPKNAPVGGRPVVWGVPGDKLTAAQETGKPRSLERVTDRPEDDPVTFAVAPQRPAEGPPPDDVLKVPDAHDDTTFAVSGLFRGRVLGMDTKVRLHNRPDLVSYQPREEKTGFIAVQADADDLREFAARNGELVVVLDYSESMVRNKVPGTDKTRIDKALEALGQCLDKLPDGVNLTILTFSTLETKKFPFCDVQRDKSPWSHDQARALMRDLSALHPAYNTPLVRAAMQAADKFTPNFQGAKTVLILTDGGDNDFHPHTGVNGKIEDTGKDIRIDRTGKERTMKDALHEAFDGKGVHIHVVGFRLKELSNPDESAGLKEFEPAVKDVGGTFQDVEDADRLAEELQKYFLQVRFWVEYDNGDPVDAAAREGLQVAVNNNNPRPISVPAPADYHVLIEAYRNESRPGHHLPDQHVHVEPGEVLVLDLKQSRNPDKPFELRRDVFARSSVLKLARPVMEPLPVGQNWLLTVLGNTPVKNKATRYARDLTLSVEDTDDHVATQGTVRQGRPRLAWFNVLPEAGKDPVSGLRFYPRLNYPAPVWQLSLADWQPPTAAPVVDAWWCEHDLPEEAVKVLSQGAGPEQYMLPSDLNGRSIDVRPTPDDPVSSLVVESVGVERRYVEEKPGQWTPDLDCLVVRLRFPPGRPYIVELPDDLMKTQSGQQAGHEHRIYTEANKYTGVFYGVGPAQLQKLTRLRLISLEGVKAKAVHPAPLAVRGEGQPVDPLK